MRYGRSFLRRQIESSVIAVHGKPCLIASGETGADAVVPLERRSFRISRLQMIPKNVIMKSIKLFNAFIKDYFLYLTNIV